MPGGRRWFSRIELDALVDALQRLRRLAAVAHEHGALDDVVVVVVADDAEARRVADLDGRDVAHADRNAGARGDDDGLDVVHVLEEADAADRVRLLAEREALAADVLVRALDRAHELIEVHAVRAEPERVDVDLVLLGLAAEATRRRRRPAPA